MTEQPPAVIATDARDNTLAKIQDLDEIDDVVETATKEEEAIQDFIDELSRAIVAGLSVSQAKQTCGVIAETAPNYTKTALKALLEERVEERKVEDSDRRPFDQILQNDLLEVVIVRTTDAKQATLYRWEFSQGSVETTANAEGREHFSWPQFRDEYFDATGEDAAKPTSDLQDGEMWREFVVEIIEDRGREVTTRGPRSAAVSDLKSFISRSRAYNDIEYMVERDGLYIDSDPRDEEPEEVWVQNHDIKRICEDNELSTVRELQIELDARGHTVDRVAGVSESKTVNRNKITYWVLDADIADYSEFVPDPVDPAEAIKMDSADESADDAEPGALGSVGGDTDD